MTQTESQVREDRPGAARPPGRLAAKGRQVPSTRGQGRRVGGKPRRSVDHPGYRRKVILWLVGPAVLCELLVYGLPIAVGIYTSFLDVNLTTLHDWLGAPFAGLSNYRLAVSVPAIAGPLLRSFVTSLIYVAIVVSVSIVIGTVAVIFVRSLRRGTRALQVLYILPYTVPVYAGVLTWDFVFQGNGAASSLLIGGLHLFSKNTLWLEGSDAFWAMVVATIWRTWPFAFLMVLAATQNIASELYEAVRIDGGNRWDEVRSVTLPHVKSTVVTLSLIMFLWTFNDFTTPYVFFGQIPPVDADLFPLHVYINSFVNASYSVGSAMTLLAVVALLVVALPYSRASGLLGAKDA